MEYGAKNEIRRKTARGEEGKTGGMNTLGRGQSSYMQENCQPFKINSSGHYFSIKLVVDCYQSVLKWQFFFYTYE